MSLIINNCNSCLNGVICHCYISGVIWPVLGSLSTCAFDKSGVLVGASGGGYAVMVAHFADLLLVSSH